MEIPNSSKFLFLFPTIFINDKRHQINAPHPEKTIELNLAK